MNSCPSRIHPSQEVLDETPFASFSRGLRSLGPVSGRASRSRSRDGGRQPPGHALGGRQNAQAERPRPAQEGHLQGLRGRPLSRSPFEGRNGDRRRRRFESRTHAFSARPEEVAAHGGVVVRLRAREGDDVLRRREGAGDVRGKGFRRCGLPALARANAAVRGSEEGNAGLTNGAPLQSLLSEKRFDLVAKSETLLAAVRGLARAGQKARIQAVAGMAEVELKKKSSDPATARLRWTILKEAVRAGATPSTPDGFHKLFEEALAAAWPSRPSLPALLGRFKFREAKDPAEGLTRAEKAEKWLPFEVGRVFSMAGRGAGKVVETNFALDSVRMDFEAAKGIAIPIGVASKGLVPLHEGHFLFEKLTSPDDLRERVVADPGLALKHLVESFGRALTMAEVKEAVKGLIAEDADRK